MGWKSMLLLLAIISCLAGGLWYFLSLDIDMNEVQIPNPIEWMREQVPEAIEALDALPEPEESIIADIPLEQAWNRISEIFAGLLGSDDENDYEEDD